MSKIFLFIFICFSISCNSCKKNDSSSGSESNAKLRTHNPEVVDVMNGMILGMKAHPTTGAADVDKVLDFIHEAATSQQINPSNPLAKWPQDPYIKLYDAALHPLKAMKSWVWRMGHLARKSDPLYAGIVRSLRAMRYRSGVKEVLPDSPNDYYMYGQHIYAVLVYLTQPHPQVGPWQSFREVQDWYVKELAPSLTNSIATAKALEAGSDDLGFLVDMKLFTGDGRFISEKKAKKTFLKPFLNHFIAQYQRAMAVGYFASSYNVDKLPFFVNEMLMRSMINNSYNSENSFLTRTSSFIRPQTPEDVSTVIRQAKYADLFALNQPAEQSKQYLNMALENYKAANALQLKSFDEVISMFGSKFATAGIYDESNQYIVNPVELKVHEEDIREQLQKRGELFNGPSTFTSKVTGETITVNVSALFSGHPDLKTFLPNQFISGADEVKTTADGKTYLRYEKGMPTGWPDPTFGGLMPSGTQGEVFKNLRTLTLTPETSVFATYIPAPTMLLDVGI